MDTKNTYTQTRKNYYNDHKTVISAKASAYYDTKKEYFKQRQKIRYYEKKRLTALQNEPNAMYAAVVLPTPSETISNPNAV